jgi:vacuolar-type H+-ATPase subunit F/Vma7
MHDQLVAALAMQEDDTYTAYKIKGINQVYEVSCNDHDHDAVVAVTAKDKNEINKIEAVIQSLQSSKGKGLLLVSKTHVLMPCVIKTRGDP